MPHSTSTPDMTQQEQPSATLKSLEAAYLKTIQNVSDYHEFKEVRSDLHQSSRTHRHSTRATRIRSWQENYKLYLSRHVGKIGKRQRASLVKTAKKKYAEETARELARNYNPKLVLGKKIADDLPWPKTVPQKVIKADRDLDEANDLYNKNPCAERLSDYNTAKNRLNACIKEWEQNTVEKAKNEYIKALIDECPDLTP